MALKARGCFQISWCDQTPHPQNFIKDIELWHKLTKTALSTCFDMRASQLLAAHPQHKFDMAHCPVGFSLAKLWSLTYAHSQLHYSGRLWHFNDAQLIFRGPACAKRFPHPPTTNLIDMAVAVWTSQSIMTFWNTCCHCCLALTTLKATKIKFFPLSHDQFGLQIDPNDELSCD